MDTDSSVLDFTHDTTEPWTAVTMTTADPQNVTLATVPRGAGHYVALVVMATVSVTAVVGNVCNILVIARSAHLRHALSNLFVVRWVVIIRHA